MRRIPTPARCFGGGRLARAVCTVAALVAWCSFGAPADALGARAGDLDPSFAGDGKLITDVGGTEVANDVLVQPNGRIVIGGSKRLSTSDSVLLRYRRSGELDDSFAAGGVRIDDFGGDDEIEAIDRLPDGRIVAAGVVDPPGPLETGFFVARYTRSGDPDPEFGGGDGVAIVPFAATTPLAHFGDMELQDDGKIVVAGSQDFPGGSWDFVVTRLEADGDLDSGFGFRWVDFNVPGPPTTHDVATAVELREAGQIVVGGYSDERFAVAVFENDGDLYVPFRSRGWEHYGPSGGSRAFALAIKPIDPGTSTGTGRILMAGMLEPTGTNPDLYLFGIHWLGDPAAISDQQDFGGLDHATDMVWADGKVVIAGGNFNDFVLTRHLIEPFPAHPDPSFKNGGTLTTDIGPGRQDQANGVALAPDGRIVLAGSSNGDFAVVRYLGAATCAGTMATIEGTPGNDELNGTAGRDVIAGLGGRDRIKGGGGRDLICGGGGTDVIRGGGGRDRLLGNGGARDKLRGGAGRDRLNGGAGRGDLCHGGGGRDVAARSCERVRAVP